MLSEKESGSIVDALKRYGCWFLSGHNDTGEEVR